MTQCSLKLAKIARALTQLGSMALFYLFSSPHAFASQASVFLPAEQVSLQYPSPVRLEKVFRDVITARPTTSPTEYPLANQLFNLDKQTQSEEFKQQVIAEVHNHFKDNKSKNALIKQVKSWQIGFRESLSLDFDVIRSDVKANPMLSGNFELITSKRSPFVRIEGLITEPKQLKFNPDSSLNSYIEKADTLADTHPSYVWIIYPDGHFVRAGYAQWNNEDIQLTPNSTIFLGFNSDATDSIKLEEKIVKLITMRRNTQ